MVHTAHLEDRGVVRISGEDAQTFLQGLVTANVETLEPERMAYGALLTPQGKILFDFLIANRDDAYLFDLSKDLVPDFLKRMTFYKLRAAVTIEDVSGDHPVFVTWDTASVPSGSFADPRHPDLGYRRYDSGQEADVDAADWHALRIALGIPDGGRDFAYGDAFPHDVAMDSLDGVDFKKGCYVGQEVVSRMAHRGTARRRIVIARAKSGALSAGAPIEAGGKPAGALGSVAGDHAIALVRLDRAKEAMDAGEAITSGDARLDLDLPSWATYSWPRSEAADG